MWREFGRIVRSMKRFALVVGVLFLAASCGDASLKSSLEKMNEAMKKVEGQQFKEAEKLLEESAALSPDNHKASYNLGMVRDRLNEPEKAAEAFEEAVNGSGDDAMYRYHLGASLFAAKKFPEAKDHLEKAVALNDRLYKAHYKLGRVYNALDMPQQAAEAWTTSAKLAPSFGKSFYQLGRLYTVWDFLDEAVSVFQQGVINVKDGDDLTNLHYGLGLAYERQGVWDKAIEAYTSSLSVRKTTLDALRQRGFAYAAKGDIENAKKDLQSFIDQGGGGDATQLQIANERLFKISALQ